MRTLLAIAAALLASSAPAETLVSNINGIQVGPDGKLQHFGALLIDDNGRVESVIKSPHLRVKRYDRLIDGEGKTLLPGFIDAHGHVMDLGFAALHLDLTATKSLADLQQRLRDYAAAHPNDTWLIGFGWNQELWPDKKFPTAADLDAIVPDRPVVLERVDSHAILANSAAMRAAGVTATTQAPAGGNIINGLFVDIARELIDKAVPAPSDAQRDEAFAKAQDILLGSGVTGAGSMSTTIDDWNDVPPRWRRGSHAGPADGLSARRFPAGGRGPLQDSPEAHRLDVRRPPPRRRDQVLRGRRAGLARRVAEAALCRQAGHDRQPASLGCRASCG